MGVQEQNDEVEIDLLEIFRALLRKWWAVALSLVIGACVAAGVTMTLITPQYEASSMIYILSKTTSNIWIILLITNSCLRKLIK